MLERFRQSGEGLDNRLPFLCTEPLQHLKGIGLDWEGRILDQIRQDLYLFQQGSGFQERERRCKGSVFLCPFLVQQLDIPSPLF